MSGKLPIVGKRLAGGVVPTGPALLALVKVVGQMMLDEKDHAKYLEHREFYLELLVFAERDDYCAPILVPIVQQVLDEESQRHRDRG